MRSHLAIATAALCAAAFVACDVPEDETVLPGEERPGYEIETPPLPPEPRVMTGDFEAPEGSDSEVSGDITLTEDDVGGFRVQAMLESLGEGPHAWHIHSAACGTDAPVVVAFTETADMEALGEPLTADGTGTATGSVTVPANVFSIDMLETGDYSVHVHEGSGVDHGPTVACADL